jgi:hypothetical protein
MTDVALQIDPDRRCRVCVVFWITFGILALSPCRWGAAGDDSAGNEPNAPRSLEQNQRATLLLSPLDADAYLTRQPKVVPRQVNFQLPSTGTPQPISPLIVEPPTAMPKPAAPSDPCEYVTEKPLGQLGINIALPSGELPVDHGTVCLASLGADATVRSWPTFSYMWDATCLCHRPLYFEEINERYGYGCGCCLQPLASAAHFFGTVPALPYCMAADCPHECVYTLGHYRPGSCPPWRRHWPPVDPLAAAAEGGVWTGMVFLIP